MDKWYIQSDSGYRVAKTLHSAVAIYTAYPPQKRGEQHNGLGFFDNPEDAKTACSKHFKGVSKNDKQAQR